MGLAICESHHQFSVSLDGGANGLIQFPHLSTHPPTHISPIYQTLQNPSLVQAAAEEAGALHI